MRSHRHLRARSAKAAAVGVLAALAAAPIRAAPDAAVLAAVERCEPDARAWLAEIVAIDSGSNDVAGLTALAGVLKPRFEQVGATVESVPAGVPDLAPSLVATLTGTGRGRVLLIAHMDTVFPPGTAAQRPYRVVGDRGIGPGAGDDKQGIVTAWCALRTLAEVRYRDYAKVTLILNSNEELGSPATSGLIADHARATPC